MFLICNIRDCNYCSQLIVSISWLFLGGEYNLPPFKCIYWKLRDLPKIYHVFEQNLSFKVIMLNTMAQNSFVFMDNYTEEKKAEENTSPGLRIKTSITADIDHMISREF